MIHRAAARASGLAGPCQAQAAGGAVAGSESVATAGPKIVVRNLFKVFRRGDRQVTALADVSLEIPEGQFCVLIGPSGCGKSTLLRILAGLEAPSAGSVEIRRSTPDAPLNAMVFQEQGVLPWMTVEENVAFGLQMRGLPRREIRERTERFLEKTQLLAFRHAYPKELSGGMKQRVSLARAFVTEPEILLMDEPFSALDEQNKFLLQEELLRIWSENQRTVVYVTHSIDEAILLGDRLVLMSARPGRIADDIPVPLPRPRHIEDLRSDPRAGELFVRIWHHLRREVAGRRELGAGPDLA
ncbi:MAG TPA: ABC transporter ATP-binding protein [Limnochorda sp.]